VRIDLLFQAPDPALVQGASVTPIQENLDGKVVDRMEQVSDGQYQAGKYKDTLNEQ
jgi:hypothetical protein